MRIETATVSAASTATTTLRHATGHAGDARALLVEHDADESAVEEADRREARRRRAPRRSRGRCA